jgi:hypothetical protein
VIKSLCYKPEGRGFETHEVNEVNAAAIGPGVYSASNRNKYQKQKNNVYVE